MAEARKRKVCKKCNQKLSHSAYVRHQNPAVCPGALISSVADVNVENTPATSEFSCLGVSDPQSNPCEGVSEVASDDLESDNVEDQVDMETSDSSSSDSEVDVNCSIEVFSEDDASMTEEETPMQLTSNARSAGDHRDSCTNTSAEGPDTPLHTSQLRIVSLHICLFLSFFQLCYKVSERGISLLLSFFRSVLLWLSTFMHSEHILQLRDLIPTNVYYLKKICGNNNAFKTYVVCPKCNAVYERKDCVFVNQNGLTESAKCWYVPYPNHPHVSRRQKCNTILMKRVKCGSNYKLRPRKVYVYNSVKSSLKKLLGRPAFLTKCELWRTRSIAPQMFTDIYDGHVWKRFRNVCGRSFLELPNSLAFILNIDWFNPYKHIQYSVGIIYLVIANLPRSERYKLENILIVGVIPGPNEPKKHMNTFLKPLIDELLDLWDGCYLQTSTMGIVPVRCALMCVTCDLPATRKACGFTSYSSLHGCSKCMKSFPCEVFGNKSDYSGYNREIWPVRTHAVHKEHISKFKNAHTASHHSELEKKYGVRYSDLLRLPYFDIVEFHVVDPMHNLLLGTGKYLMSLWKESGVLRKEQLDNIQDEVNEMQVPADIGRIPHKIASNFSGFTADQWKNWITIYSTLCLRNMLPPEHYECWSLFQEACCLLLKPSISSHHVVEVDEKLTEFCTKYEALYGKEKCTPNMHMHLHLRKCVENYGPVSAFWCFPFERFNGILGRFQNNWISPETQMAQKFLTYQNLLTMDVSTALPQELKEFFEFQLGKCGEISIGEGSLEQSHVDSLKLLEYSRNATCVINEIDATDSSMYMSPQRYENFFDSCEVASIASIYNKLYPEVEIGHIPMVHERFYEVKVFNERLTSVKSRGNHSSAICAYWAGIGGNLLGSQEYLRVGIVQYFFRHTICIRTSPTKVKYVAHVFAHVHWYRRHWRESWFHHRALVLQPDMDVRGPATNIPIARVFSRCGLLSKTVQFDCGEDNVVIAILCSSNHCV